MSEAKLKLYPADTVIIREGEINPDMFKIVKGHAEVYVNYGRDNAALIGILKPSECFGEFGLLLKEPSIYTVVAYSDLYAMRISEENIDLFIHENHSSVLNIMRNMAKTMMTMRFHIDLLIKELESGGEPDAKVLNDARKAMKAYGMYRSIEEAVHSMGVSGDGSR